MEDKTIVRKLSLVTLMGLPASGKSSFADTIVSLFSESEKTFCIILRYDDFVPLQTQKEFLHTSSIAKVLRKNFLVTIQYLASTILKVNNDSLVDLLSSSSSESGNPLIDSNIFVQRIENILQEYKFQIEHCDKCFIVVDDNNYYKSMRNELYRIAKTLQCSFCVLYLKISVNQCVERNSHRPLDSQVSSQAIEEMNKKLEEPNPLENTCDLYCVQINETVDKEIHQSVKSLLEYSLENPVVYTPPPDRSKDRRICNENEIHQADLVLRKWINSQLTLTSFDSSHLKSSANRKLKAQQFNWIKSTVLQKLKCGEFTVSAHVSQDVEFRKEIISFTTNVTVPPSESINNGTTESSSKNNIESALNTLKLSDDSS